DAVDLHSVPKHLGNCSLTGQVHLGEMPIDSDLAGDFTDPAANDPVFQRIGAGGGVKVGPAEELTQRVKRPVAIEPVPLRGVPEIGCALRAGAAGKPDELRAGISGPGTRFDPITVKPAARALHAVG